MELHMGITPITDAKGLSEQIIPVSGPVKPVENSGSDFRSIWNNQAKGLNGEADHPVNKTPGPDRKDAAGRRSDGTKTDVKSRDSSETASDTVINDTGKGKMLKDEEIESAQEVLAAAAADLGLKLTDILNISPGEFEELLEASGIDVTGLLDKDTLSAFLLSALGEESNVTLLTNEENYEIFSLGMDALSDVLSEEVLGGDLSVSELKNALEEISNTRSSEETLAAQPDRKDEPVTRFVRNSDGELEKVSENTEGTQNGERVEISGPAGAERQRNGSEDGRGSENAQQAFGNGTLNVNDAPEIPVSEPPANYTPTSREIADQILDYMRTVTNGDYSEVEMQLHPASLGTLQIHISNNSGVITASFMTENEAVRAAVESQIVRLNEQFEAQGIRVDAVEVTVASHSFEENLDSRSGAGEDEPSGNRRRTRRIDLDGDAGDLDTSSMDDDERIAAEMMAANGNKVDYTV